MILFFDFNMIFFMLPVACLFARLADVSRTGQTGFQPTIHLFKAIHFKCQVETPDIISNVS